MYEMKLVFECLWSHIYGSCWIWLDFRHVRLETEKLLLAGRVSWMAWCEYHRRHIKGERLFTISNGMRTEEEWRAGEITRVFLAQVQCLWNGYCRSDALLRQDMLWETQSFQVLLNDVTRFKERHWLGKRETKGLVRCVTSCRMTVMQKWSDTLQ